MLCGEERGGMGGGGWGGGGEGWGGGGGGREVRDASGIGPEIVAKVLAKSGERVVVFGSYIVMQDIVRRLGLNIEVRRIDAADAAVFPAAGN